MRATSNGNETAKAIGAGLVQGFRGFAAEIKEVSMEQRLLCVQCDDYFRQSFNGPTSCSYHRAEYSSWDKKYPCCSSRTPCQTKSHRADHHCEYPYGSFFARSSRVWNYTDTVAQWVNLEDTNLETNTIQKAAIGQLLRWAPRGPILEDFTIIISVGRVSYTEKYFLNTFTSTQLEEVSKKVAKTKETTIFRNSTSEDEFSMAEWVLSSDGTSIVGVRLTAKTGTSASPSISVCPIDISTGTKSGDVEVVSEAGLRMYKPATPYVLPETIRIGGELDEKPLRELRTDFKTRTTAALPVLLKVTSDPPLKPNPNPMNARVDNFVGAVSIFNKNPADVKNPITIDSITAQFRLVGDDTYLPVKSLKVMGRGQLPLSIPARDTWAFQFVAEIPRPEHDLKLDVRWTNRPFISRSRPFRLKLIITDIEGEESSLVIEHIHVPFKIEKAHPDDLAFLYFDDRDRWVRNSLHVTKPSRDDKVISIGGTDLDAERLQKAVFDAFKTGETEVDLEIAQDRDTWGWSAYALVDTSCKRVYAVKVLMKSKTCACLGYVACPAYGSEVNETRPVSYAAEKVKIPDLEPVETKPVVLDDAVDEFVPEPPKPVEPVAPVAAVGFTATKFVIPAKLTTRVASIDTNLLRIADGLDGLIAVLNGKSLL